VDSEDTLRFSQRNRVVSTNEIYPLEQAQTALRANDERQSALSRGAQGRGIGTFSASRRRRVRVSYPGCTELARRRVAPIERERLRRRPMPAQVIQPLQRFAHARDLSGGNHPEPGTPVVGFLDIGDAPKRWSGWITCAGMGRRRRRSRSIGATRAGRARCTRGYETRTLLRRLALNVLFPTLSTTRKRALPLIIRSYAVWACSRG